MENGSLTSYLSAMNQTLTNATKFLLLSHVVAGLRFRKYGDILPIKYTSSILSTVHSHSIIHGNLSSNNVLIDNRHTVRLADYGLSSVVSMCGELLQSHLCGALRWTAPELISNDDQELGNESKYHIDIYSFGCIMLHMLSGKLPYWWLDDVLRVVFCATQWRQSSSLRDGDAGGTCGIRPTLLVSFSYEPSYNR
ncbi:kinase-like domain-containing protein [Suillus cothurnatus]|nr:kinase-like domain-containing protein [Suillus cothurnatus]